MDATRPDRAQVFEGFVVRMTIALAMFCGFLATAGLIPTDLP